MPEKILLVDDDLDTLRLVGLMLQRQGYEIQAASSGLQALEMVANEAPDLILLDVMMPEIDGYEVTRRLRSNPATSEIPIIMFTAKSQIDDKVLGFDAGADDYLTKPTQPRELFAHMKAILSRSRKARTIKASARQRGFTMGIISARGGLGVTTLALNLGVALAASYPNEVIVAEFRPGQGTIGLELGYIKPEGLNRLLQSRPTEITGEAVNCELVSHACGVRLLLASYLPRDARNLSMGASFEAIARQLPSLARYVILDLGSSLTPISEKVLDCCDLVIVVTEPFPNTLTQSKALLDDLYAAGIGEGRVEIALIDRDGSGGQLTKGQAQEQLGYRISTILTPAPALAYQATIHNLPLVLQQPDSLTAQEFTKLAERVSQRNR